MQAADEPSLADDSDDNRSVTPLIVLGGVAIMLLLAFILWFASWRSSAKVKSASGPTSSAPQEAALTTPAAPTATPPAASTDTPTGTASVTPSATPSATPSTPAPETAGSSEPSEDQPAQSSVIEPAQGSGSEPASLSDAASSDDTPPSSDSTREPQTITLPGEPPYVFHRVVRGDWLSKIARRYLYDMMRYPELVEENDIPNPDLIYPGDIIRVPVARKEEEE